tara:strand:+ start:542 stop:1258 length:717 start_codon:yes stop_codon:yes gene_type:complete
MKYEYKTWIAPSGYIYNEDTGDLEQKYKEEHLREREIPDLSGVLSDIQKLFKKTSDSWEESGNLGISTTSFNINLEGSDDKPLNLSNHIYEDYRESIERLASKYGLIKIYRRKEDEAFFLSHGQQEHVEEERAKLQKEDVSEWIELIRLVFRRINGHVSDQDLNENLKNLSLFVSPDNSVTLIPTDLMSAMSCHLMGKGLHVCEYSNCGQVFIKKRANQRFHSDSCVVMNSKKREQQS